MANTAIGIGALLIVVSLVSYTQANSSSPTIFIPAGVGLLILVLGVIARNEHARKHAMHAAAAVGLLGFLAAAGRLTVTLLKGGWNGLAVSSLAAMAVLCLIFVILCIRSFIDARRRRTAGDVV